MAFWKSWEGWMRGEKESEYREEKWEGEGEGNKGEGEFGRVKERVKVKE